MTLDNNIKVKLDLENLPLVKEEMIVDALKHFKRL